MENSHHSYLEDIATKQDSICRLRTSGCSDHTKGTLDHYI